MTAVEWLIKQIKNDQNQNALSAKEWIKVIEQAKEMERLQLADAQSYAISNADMTNNRGYFDCDKWYTETYGSNGNFKQFSLYEHKETIATDNTPTSSQTEISDEKIEEMLFHHSNEYAIGFKDAIKWYREQLKNK